MPLHPESIYFSDEKPEQFDNLVPDHAPHRDVDLLIKKAVEEKRVNAKVSIMLREQLSPLSRFRFPSSIRTRLRSRCSFSPLHLRTWNGTVQPDFDPDPAMDPPLDPRQTSHSVRSEALVEPSARESPSAARRFSTSTRENSHRTNTRTICRFRTSRRDT